MKNKRIIILILVTVLLSSYVVGFSTKLNLSTIKNILDQEETSEEETSEEEASEEASEEETSEEETSEEETSEEETSEEETSEEEASEEEASEEEASEEEASEEETSEEESEEKIHPKPTVTVNKKVPRVGDKIVFKVGDFSYRDKDKAINNDYGISVNNYEGINNYNVNFLNIEAMQLNSISIPDIKILKYNNQEWIDTGSEKGLFINARQNTGYVEKKLGDGRLQVSREKIIKTIEEEFKLSYGYLKEYTIVGNSLSESGESETPKTDKYNGYLVEGTVDFEYVIKDKITTKPYGLFNGILYYQTIDDKNIVTQTIKLTEYLLYYETATAKLSIVDAKEEYEPGDIVKIKVLVTNESENIVNRYLQFGVHEGYKDYLENTETPEKDTLFKSTVGGNELILPGEKIESEIEYKIPDNIDEKYIKDGNLMLTPFLYTNSAKKENDKTEWFNNYDERQYDNSISIPLKGDKINIKVKLDGNGGSFNTENIKYIDIKKGNKIDKSSLELPKRTGYKFIGWSILKDVSSYYDFNNAVYKELTLYAYWEKNNGTTPPSTGGGGSSGGGGGSKKEIIPETKIEFDLNKLNHLAYIKGYKDQTVQPEGTLTREEAAMVFYRILNTEYRQSVETEDHRYLDIGKGLWSEKAIATLTQIGLVNGYKDGSFRPKEKITRGELSKIIAKFTETVDGETKFNDIKGHWAEKFINSMEYRKWINGYEDGSFRPNDPIKRNEFVKIINLVLERNVDYKTIPFEIKEFKDLNKDTWYYNDMVEATNGHRYIIKDKIETWIEKDEREFQ